MASHSSPRDSLINCALGQGNPYLLDIPIQRLPPELPLPSCSILPSDSTSFSDALLTRFIYSRRLGADRGADAVPLVLRNPLLLLTPPMDALAPSLDKAIDMMMGLPRRRMARLLRQCPRLLTTPPAQITAQFREMVVALRVSPLALVGMLGREPKLLQVGTCGSDQLGLGDNALAELSALSLSGALREITGLS